MSNDKFTNIVIALSGIIQAADLVTHLAYTGNADQNAMQASMNSVFTIDASDIHAVYGGINNIHYGAKQFLKLLEKSRNHQDQENARYMFSLMLLEKQLSKDPEKLKQLARRLDYAKSQVEHFGLEDETVLKTLADIYQQVLSSFDFRIRVTGKREYLTDETRMMQIRCLLLAGIRSAVLWRQVGGTKWQLLFRRGRIKQALINLIN